MVEDINLIITLVTNLSFLLLRSTSSLTWLIERQRLLLPCMSFHTYYVASLPPCMCIEHTGILQLLQPLFTVHFQNIIIRYKSKIKISSVREGQNREAVKLYKIKVIILSCLEARFSSFFQL